MLSAGIVGLPNVGKSTLFNAVTRTQKAQAANYPFCTIDPNLGIVTVPDPRLEALSKLSHSQKIVPAAIEFVDIAGLVKGASAGEGLGNQFLSHIREVNAIVQVVRCFESGDIHHVSGSIDPVRDIEVINTELILADLASLQKRRDRLQKEVRGRLEDGEGRDRRDRKTPAASRLRKTGDHARADRRGKSDCARIFPAHLEADALRLQRRRKRSRRRSRRGDDAERRRAQHVRAVEDYARAISRPKPSSSARRSRANWSTCRKRKPRNICAISACESSGVGALIRAVYHLLGLRTYLTTGEKETRAWTIHAGDKAPAAAGVIHTDFERGFIAAETVHFDDLVVARLVSPKRAKPASCGSKARNTSSRTATWSSSASTSDSAPPRPPCF